MRTNSLRAFLATGTMLCALGFGSLAVDAAPQAVFYPASAWVVDGQDGICSIRTEYNNGYIVGFDTGTNGFESMQVDFRQDIFTQGQDYAVSVNMKTAQAKARETSVLDINISHYPDLYKALVSSGEFDLSVEGNVFKFYTTGIDDQAKALSACTTPVVATVETTPPTPDSDLVDDLNAIIEADVQMAKDNSGQSISTSVSAPHPSSETISMTSPEPVVTRQYAKAKIDITGAGLPKSDPSTDYIAQLKRKINDLQATNKQLKDNAEKSSAAVAGTEEYQIKTDNWDLEKATLRFQEAERQLKLMGQKLQRERAKFVMEKKELESMLFDPQLTNERQMAELATLESKLAEAQEKLIEQRLRYEERIKVLQEQLNGL